MKASASNRFSVPCEWLDSGALWELSHRELKVLLYILRRTTGFHKMSDMISLSQMQEGITLEDGSKLDEGCGVKDRSDLCEVLKKLEGLEFIEREGTRSSPHVKGPTLYRILEESGRGVVGKSPTRGVGGKSPTIGSGQITHIQVPKGTSVDSVSTSSPLDQASSRYAKRFGGVSETTKKALLSLLHFRPLQAVLDAIDGTPPKSGVPLQYISAILAGEAVPIIPLDREQPTDKERANHRQIIMDKRAFDMTQKYGKMSYLIVEEWLKRNGDPKVANLEVYQQVLDEFEAAWAKEKAAG